MVPEGMTALLLGSFIMTQLSKIIITGSAKSSKDKSPAKGSAKDGGKGGSPKRQGSGKSSERKSGKGKCVLSQGQLLLCRRI